MATTRNGDTKSAVHLRGGQVHKAVTSFEVATADLATTGDIIPIIEIPPEAIVTSIKAIADELDTNVTPTLEFDIGIYAATKWKDLADLDMDNDVVAKDADAYFDGGSQTVFEAAIATPTELINTDPLAFNKTVRERAGDSIGEEPLKYFIGAKCVTNAATAAAVTLTFLVEYLQG